MSALDIRKDLSRLVKAPEKLSVVDAAKRYVKVRSASGGVIPWDAELTPYMIEPMNCVNSRDYDAVIFVGPAQSGKTQGLITNVMAYVIKHDPCDFMILQTTKGTARDFDTQVIKRAFRDCPELNAEKAPGSKSDNTYDKVFKSGAILFQRWPSINEISGKPLKYVLLTDYDRMTQNVDGEGSPYSLAQQRTAKFLSRGKTVVDTSPGFEITDPNKKLSAHEAPPCGGALSLYNMGDMRRWYVQCPQCGEYFMPPADERGLSIKHERDLFGVTLTDIDQDINFVCTKNGCLISVKHKKQLNKSGLWVPQGCHIENGKLAGQRIKSRIAAFWFPGNLAAYADSEKLVDKYLKGWREYDITGAEENLKTVVNVNFGAPYLPRALLDAVQTDDLSKRSKSMERYVVPEWTRVLIAAVDIQNGKTGRFVVQVHAVGEMMEQCVVDRYDIDYNEAGGIKRRVDPGVYLEDFDLLTDKVIKSSYKTPCGRKMLVHLVGIDTGGLGNTTANAYQYYKKLIIMGLASKVKLFKGGSSDDKSPIVRSFGKDSRGTPIKSVPLYILNTNTFKDMVASMLKRETGGGLYLHLPRWLPDSFFDELNAERRGDNGKWEKIRERNEALDLCVYIMACVHFLGLHEVKFWSNPAPWAHPILANNSNVVSADEARKIREFIDIDVKKQDLKPKTTIAKSDWSSRL